MGDLGSIKDHLPGLQYIVRAPGRVNLLGEHVDYNDGPVLPVAIDRCVHLAVQARSDRQVHLIALDLEQEVNFDLDHLNERLDSSGKPLPGWAQYPAGVAWALLEQGFSLSGMQAVYTSDVPIGAGLSSSAAVQVAFAAAWQALGGWTTDRITLAKICQRAENEYLGLHSGLMDQFASMMGIAGHALYFDTRTLNWEALPLPAMTSIVIADSGVRRSLTTSAYNDRQAACIQAVERLQAYLPGITALRDVSPEQFSNYGYHLPEVIHKRSQHVIEEIARVNQAVGELKKGDAVTFGQLMFAGHISLRDLYEVSIPELDILVATASQIPGCLGARLTGAGFGGCTVNFVESQTAPEFISALKSGYQETTGREIQVYLCQASHGVRVEPQ